MKAPVLASALMFLTLSAVPAVQAAPMDAPVNRPLGVAEVPWGSSLADAKKAMLARPGVTLTSETPNKLVFQGGTFAEQPAEKWELLFTKEKFTEAMIHLQPVDALRQYEEIRKLITAKYRKAGREDKESPEHRATYWEYVLTTGKWGIACDVRLPKTLTIVYKDKSPVQPGTGKVKDL